jgi:hypothetical protein
MGKKRRQKPKAPEWRESRQVKGQDELYSENQVLATLRWGGCFSHQAVGTTPEGQWTFDRPHLLSRDIEIQQNRTGAHVATFEYGFFKVDKLKFADGRVLHWVATDFWQSKWAFTTPEGTPLLRLVDNSGIFKTRALLTFICSTLTPADRALLILLARYLMEMHRRDSAAGAAGASTAAVM